MSEWPPIPQPRLGDRLLEVDGDRWIVACAYHRGEAEIGHEQMLDDAGAPVLGEHRFTDAQGTVHVELLPYLRPIHSDDVGYSPACQACRRTFLETRQHIVQVRLSVEQAEFELGAQIDALRTRRGEASS